MQIFRLTCGGVWVIMSLMLLTVMLIAGHVMAYPRPAIITYSWEIDARFQAPGLISVQLPGKTESKLYWYLPYTVSNNTGEDRLWIPQVSVYTDRGQLIQAGRNVPAIVFLKIREVLRNHLLESPVDVVGTLLQGDDNARDSVVIWQAPEGDVDTFSVFIGGLSGETQLVTDPVTGEAVTLCKTKVLMYSTPGDETHYTNKPIQFVCENWIMR